MTTTRSPLDGARWRSQVVVSRSRTGVDWKERSPSEDILEASERGQEIQDGLRDLDRRMQALTKQIDTLPGYGTVAMAVLAMHLATFVLIGIGVVIGFGWHSSPG